MRRLMIGVTAGLLAVAGVVFAQPQDRRVSPTAPAAPDPCSGMAMDRAPAPEPVSPGYDPRVPMPPGATSRTGVAPPSREPSVTFPAPPPAVADQAYQDCLRRTGR